MSNSSTVTSVSPTEQSCITDPNKQSWPTLNYMFMPPVAFQSRTKNTTHTSFIFIYSVPQLKTAEEEEPDASDEPSVPTEPDEALDTV